MVQPAPSVLYTAFSFHLPRRKRTALLSASVENAIVTAREAPTGPIATV